MDCGEVLVDPRSKRCPSCSTRGERNGLWKGDTVGYDSLHQWIKNHKPKPEFCEDCGKVKPYDLANISGEYKRDIDDFEWLCRSCHMKKDGRLKKLLKNGTRSRTRKRDGDLFQCRKCKEFKKSFFFSINKYSKDGLEYCCKYCYVDINKKKHKRSKMVKKCSICKKNKPDGQVDLQYGRLICSECLPAFEKNAKKEANKIVEMI